MTATATVAPAHDGSLQPGQLTQPTPPATGVRTGPPRPSGRAALAALASLAINFTPRCWPTT